MARTCKYGKLKNPVGRRVCKKPPRGKARRSTPTALLNGAGRQRRKRR